MKNTITRRSLLATSAAGAVIAAMPFAKATALTASAQSVCSADHENYVAALFEMIKDSEILGETAAEKLIHSDCPTCGMHLGAQAIGQTAIQAAA